MNFAHQELEGSRDAARAETDHIQREISLLKTGTNLLCPIHHDSCVSSSEHAALAAALAVSKSDVTSKLTFQKEGEVRLNSLRLELDASAANLLAAEDKQESDRRAVELQVVEASDRMSEAVLVRDALFVALEKLKAEEGLPAD